MTVRLIPAFETWPRMVAFAQTRPGRVLLVLSFIAAFAPLQYRLWWQTGLVLLVTTFFPGRRRLWLGLAALWWVVVRPPVPHAVLHDLARQYHVPYSETWWPLAVVAVLAFGGTLAAIGRRWPRSVVGRHPVVVLVVSVVAIQATAPAAPIGWLAMAGMLGGLVLAQYIWFFAYALSASGMRTKTPFWQQVGLFRPFWGFSLVPYAKGHAYLSRIEEHDPTRLAITQLKGVKLACWALLLGGVQLGLDTVVTGDPFGAWFGIPTGGMFPTYGEALARQIQGAPYAWSYRVAALVLHFSRHALNVAVSGHTIIAVCRMAGFGALRNTYRPLSSTTIAEFYNRIFYYFKELLVEFFFFPSYLRFFKSHPRLRLFTATLLSAGFGNFLYHFLRHDGLIAAKGLPGALWSVRVYAVYALLLGTAIGVSQLRSDARGRRRPAGWRRLRAVAGVLGFYILMTVFDDPAPGRTVSDCLAFLSSLCRP